MAVQVTQEQIQAAAYINSIQLMTEAWSRDLLYSDYAAYAAALGKYVHTANEYHAHCQSCEDRMVQFMAEGIGGPKTGI